MIFDPSIPGLDYVPDEPSISEDDYPEEDAEKVESKNETALFYTVC